MPLCVINIRADLNKENRGPSGAEQQPGMAAAGLTSGLERADRKAARARQIRPARLTEQRGCPGDTLFAL